MASNNGRGSTNPPSKNTKKEKMTTSNISALICLDDAEPQMLKALAPTGKRRRSSETSETRRDTMGQAESLQYDEAVTDEAGTNEATGANAAATSIPQGNGTLMQIVWQNVFFTTKLLKLTAFLALFSLKFCTIRADSSTARNGAEQQSIPTSTTRQFV